MNLFKFHRCPWCGEVTSALNGRKYHFDRVKKCAFCGKKYTYYDGGIFSRISKSSFLFLLLTIFTLAINMYVFYVSAVICIVLTGLDFMTTYERYDDEYKFKLKKYSAKFNIKKKKYNLISLLHNRLFLMDKSIISICFVDKNEKPISHNICISIENTKKINSQEYECIFTFLPLSPVHYQTSENDNFFIFDNKYKIAGNGTVISEYNNFI